MLTLFFEVTNVNLLPGFMPESIGLLLFGGGLIAFAVTLRRVFNWKDDAQQSYEKLAKKIN